MTDLLSIHQAFVQACERAHTRLGAAGRRVSRTKLLILLYVQNGVHRASKLAEALNITRQAVAQQLDQLEAQGLIWRSRSRDDLRALYVGLSAEGQALVEAAQQ